MKKRVKLGLGLFALFGGAMLLTGCTNSFCSKEDKAHILYAFDFGVSEYHEASEEATLLAAGKNVQHIEGYDNIVAVASFDKSAYLNLVNAQARDKQNFAVPSLTYYFQFDNVVLDYVVEAAGVDKATVTAAQLNGDGTNPGLLDEHGDLKYYVKNTENKAEDKLWVRWSEIDNKVRTNGTVPDINQCPTTDYISFYQRTMTTAINNYRACISVKSGYYGHYNGSPVKITGKTWSYAWGVGPLSGLIVYPIGWGIESITTGLLKTGVGHGYAQLLAILIITVIVRGILLAATFKQTNASNRMQELQPEIAKIQAKYPNSNTNNYEKQKVAEETARLYKKHKINPMGTILIMFIQFPVFICVWGAMQGSAWLSSDAVLGLRLSDSIGSVLTTWRNWSNPSSGVWTALVLFLLMSGSQVVSMLLPQWLNKAKMKNVAKLGKNPAQKQNNNRMKWFTYIMLAMIIFMGFSLASAMGVYWLVGALISIVQTLITHAIQNKKQNAKSNKR
ncbi:MAG: membrane protein insertase YidC [Bacilli bacterium]|nr:membrane protein insertase YidC [Bacilli bacterium]